MYEQFRNKFAASLDGKVPDDKILTVLRILDSTSADWNFTKQETALAIPADVAMDSVKEYLYSKKALGQKTATCKNILSTLKLFYQYVNKSPENVQPRDIRNFLAWYSTSSNVCNQTLEHKRQHLSAYFQWLLDEGYIDKNPVATVHRIHFNPTPQKRMSSEEVAQMRWADGLSIRQKALIEFFNSTACRVSEVSKIKTSDINWDTKTAMALGKGDKYRPVYLNDSAIIALKAYLETRNDDRPYLFVTSRNPHIRLGARSIANDLAKATKAKGITGVTTHTFRRTTATRMLQSGADVTVVQKMLGHACVSTTMIYAQQAQESVQQAHTKYII